MTKQLYKNQTRQNFTFLFDFNCFSFKKKFFVFISTNNIIKMCFIVVASLYFSSVSCLKINIQMGRKVYKIRIQIILKF